MLERIKELFGSLFGQARQTVEEHANIEGLQQDAGEAIQNVGGNAEDVRNQAEGGINEARDKLGGINEARDNLGGI
jgi:hypothetical protein